MTTLLLDRDGTIIEDVGFITTPDDVRLLDGVAEALSALQQRGFQFVVVSNQSGVGRGIVPLESVAQVDDRMRQLLQAAGVTIAGSYYCFHAPDEGCNCRKPSPVMLRQAAADLGFDLETAWMVGDRESDADAGLNAGCERVFAIGFTSRSEAVKSITGLSDLVETDD